MKVASKEFLAKFFPELISGEILEPKQQTCYKKVTQRRCFNYTRVKIK